MTSHHFSISAQISEVERELKMRRQVYPHQVRTGKLRQSVAEYQTDALAAVLESLQWNRENRADVIEWVKAGKPKAAAA